MTSFLTFPPSLIVSVLWAGLFLSVWVFSLNIDASADAGCEPHPNGSPPWDCGLTNGQAMLFTLIGFGMPISMIHFTVFLAWREREC